MATASAKQGRPSPEAIREAVWRAIDREGADGISRTWLRSSIPGSGVEYLMTDELDAALAALESSGRITRHVEAGQGRAATVYRSAAAVEREAWLRAEIKRRGLDRPRSVPVLGRVF